MYTYIELKDGRFQILDPFDRKLEAVDTIEEADAFVWAANDLSLLTRH